MDTCRLRSKTFLIGLICVFGVALTLLTLNALTNVQIHIAIGNPNLRDVEETGVLKDVYQKRFERVKRVCTERGLHTETYTKPALIYSAEHRIASRAVAKVGSTSTLIVFKILNDRASENDFEKSRSGIHGGKFTKKYKKSFDLKSLRDYTVLIPARDPYSRLYSAYIDKVYMADKVELLRDVLKHAVKRGNSALWWRYNVTFQMFLDYAFDQSVSNHILDGHYKPLFKLKLYSWLCSLDNFIIIKQESFSSDFEYALNVVNVEEHKMKKIKDVLQSRRTETTVIGIVKTEMNKLRGRFRSMGQFKNSTNRYDASIFLLERIWKTFQIQGHLNVKSNFPHEKFSSERFVFDVNYILKTILEEIKSNPLTPSDSKRQRQEAMSTAYGNIKRETIHMIRTTYNLDFQAFGYNLTLPT